MQRFINFLRVYPWLIAGFAGLAFRILTEYAGFHIDSELWRNGVDILSYALIGIGVYSKHDADKKANTDAEDPYDKFYDI
jgi:hypothetical protein